MVKLLLLVAFIAQPSFLELERQNLTPLPPLSTLGGGTLGTVLRQNGVAWLFSPSGSTFGQYATGQFISVSGCTDASFNLANVPIIKVLHTSTAATGVVYPYPAADVTPFAIPTLATVLACNDSINLGVTSLSGEGGSVPLTTAAAAIFTNPPAIVPITDAMSLTAPQQFNNRTVWGYIFTLPWGSNPTGFSGLACNMHLFRKNQEQIVYPFSLYSNIPTNAQTASTAFIKSAASFVSQTLTDPQANTLPLYLYSAMVGETTPIYLLPFPANVQWDWMRVDLISRVNVSKYRLYLAASSH